MIIEVQGQRLEVPDGLSPEQLNEVVDDFARSQPAQQQQRGIMSSIMPAVEGFNLGVETTGRGIGQASAEVLGSLGAPVGDLPERFAAGQQQAEKQFEEQYGDSFAGKAGRFVGELGSLAPLAPVLPGGLITQGALGGGIEQFTRPQEEPGLLERGMRTGTGAALGALGGKVFKMGGSALANVGAKIKQQGRFSDLLADVVSEGVDETQAFKRMVYALGKESEKLGKQVSANYDEAKRLGEEFELDTSELAKYADEVAEKARKEVIPDSKQALINIAENIKALGKQDIVTVNDLQTIRSGASKASSKGLYAAGEVAGEIDDFIMRQAGDDPVGKAWKKAIDSRREFAQKFEDPSEIAYALTNEPLEAIESKFWSRGTFNPKSARIYDDVIKALPEAEQEPAGKLMRQSIVNKMIRNATDKVDAPGELSGEFLANRISGLRRNNQSLWNKFTPEEKDMLNTLESNIREESGAGLLNKVGGFLTRALNRSTGANLELPRTIKPKTVYSLEDVVRLTKVRPVIKGSPLPGAGVSSLGTLALEE